jgi:hypothetical protein
MIWGISILPFAWNWKVRPNDYRLAPCRDLSRLCRFDYLLKVKGIYTMLHDTIKTACLVIIAACLVATTFVLEDTIDGGINVFFGNFGYHFEGSAQ